MRRTLKAKRSSLSKGEKAGVSETEIVTKLKKEKIVMKRKSAWKTTAEKGQEMKSRMTTRSS